MERYLREFLYFRYMHQQKRRELVKRKHQERIHLFALLKEIVSHYGGAEAERLVDILERKNDVNEFFIAKKLGLSINQTRNILYKLADVGLISFIRTKDKKKGGWYTYFWTLEIEKSLQKFKTRLLDEIRDLQQQQQNRKTSRFFFCKNCGLEYTEEQALHNNYTCPECGETLSIRESGDFVDSLRKEIKKRSDHLDQVSDVLSRIREKDQLERERRVVMEKKKRERELKRIRRRNLIKSLGEKGLSKKSRKREKRERTGHKSRSKKRR